MFAIEEMKRESGASSLAIGTRSQASEISIRSTIPIYSEWHIPSPSYILKYACSSKFKQVLL